MFHSVRQDNLIRHYEIRGWKRQTILGSQWRAEVFEIIIKISLSLFITLFPATTETHTVVTAFVHHVSGGEVFVGRAGPGESDETTCIPAGGGAAAPGHARTSTRQTTSIAFILSILQTPGGYLSGEY